MSTDEGTAVVTEEAAPSTGLGIPPATEKPAESAEPSAPPSTEQTMVSGTMESEAQPLTIDQQLEKYRGKDGKFLDKFDTVDDVFEGYKNAQKHISKSKADMADRDLNGHVEAAGLEMQDVTTNWKEQGHLSETQYDAFQKYGFSRTLVDTVLSAQYENAQAINAGIESRNQQAYDLVGSQVKYENLAQWVADQHSGTPEGRAKLARRREALAGPDFLDTVRTMMQEHTEAMGRGFTQPQVQGTSMPSAATGFRTFAELTNAIRENTKTNGETIPPDLMKRIQATDPNIRSGMIQ